MVSISGFRDSEDFPENLVSLCGRHWLVPPPVVGTQVLHRGLEVVGGDSFCVDQEAVLPNQPNEVLPIRNEPKQEFFVER